MSNTDKNSAPKKGALSVDEKLAMVAKWKASGLSSNAFAAEAGIGSETLRRWSRGEGLSAVGRPLGHRGRLPESAKDAARLERKRQVWRSYYAKNMDEQRARNRENYARRKLAAARPEQTTSRLKQIRAERTARQQRAMGIAP